MGVEVSESVYDLISLLLASEVMLEGVSGRGSCGRVGSCKSAVLKELSGCCSAHGSSGSTAKPLWCHTSELQETSQQAQCKFKSEKQSRRQLELRVTSLEEELTDLRTEKESLEKVSSSSQVSPLYPGGQSGLFNKHFYFPFKKYCSMCSL